MDARTFKKEHQMIPIQIRDKLPRCHLTTVQRVIAANPDITDQELFDKHGWTRDEVQRAENQANRVNTVSTQEKPGE